MEEVVKEWGKKIKIRDFTFLSRDSLYLIPNFYFFKNMIYTHAIN